jgi:hypothetical protein
MNSNNARTGIVGISVIPGLIALGFLYISPGHTQTPAVAGPGAFDVASVSRRLQFDSLCARRRGSPPAMRR